MINIKSPSFEYAQFYATISPLKLKNWLYKKGSAYDVKKMTKKQQFG